VRVARTGRGVYWRSMLSPRLLAVAALASSGCTIIYDPDDLRPPPPDAIPIDADPALLTLTGTSPATIAEGTGDGGGRPALIVIEGNSIVRSATITATLDPDGSATPIEVLQQAVSALSDYAVVAVRIPVLDTLAAGDTTTLRFTVTQAGATQTQDLTVDGLDELTLASSPVAEGSFAALYSRITVTAPVHVTGGATAGPVQLHATANIELAALLDVDAAGTTPGPHGCDGGSADAPGDCGNGGGHQGTNPQQLNTGGGGGGGGFAPGASGGSGNAGGAAGGETGNDMLVPIATTGPGNRGNGGGGGSAGLLTSGGSGGGGGGVIDLVAGGDLVVSGGLRATGANGTASNGSGGGGGSGGAILVRAGGTITSSGAWLEARGGGGADGSGQSDGGAGSVGRIRVDSPTGGVDTMADTPAAVAGPAWDLDSPWFAGARDVTLTLHGAAGRSFGILVDGDATGADATTGTSGTATVDVELEPGRHAICAAYAPSGQGTLSVPEATTCIDVAYVP